MLSSHNLSLKTYYKRELDYLRQQATGFAKDHPLIADALKLSRGQSADTHIEMLLQSFAFLCGRLHHRLDAELPQVSNQLLANLYPHLITPMPSMAIVEAQVIPDGANFSNGYTLPRGRLLTTNGYSDQSGKATCSTSLCYDTDLWPLHITRINSEPTNHHEFLTGNTHVRSVLKLRVEATGADPIKNFNLQTLRFYINGDEAQTGVLYALLANHLAGVALINDKNDLRILDNAQCMPQGFSEEQAALPDHPGTHPGYRLLQEYFCFPQKFLFLDLEGLSGVDANQHFDILLLLNQSFPSDLNLDHSVIKLNCSPVINLFTKTTEPICLDKTQSEYRLVPDASNYRYCEVHTIKEVKAVNAAGSSRLIAPYFALDDQETGKTREFWALRREASQSRALPGSEVFLSLFDSDGQSNSPAEDMVYAKALCCNRKLMENIRTGARFDLEGGGPVSGMVVLTKPSRHQSPALQGDAPWQLISQLTLNHLSLSNNPHALATLKQILSLHAGEHNMVNQRQIDSICDLKVRPVTHRIGEDAWRGFCEGMEITLTIDEDIFQGATPLLFGEILSRFFGLYVSVNSFTQLVLENKRQNNGMMKKWRPTIGEQELI